MTVCADSHRLPKNSALAHDLLPPPLRQKDYRARDASRSRDKEVGALTEFGFLMSDML